jgi:hypothetical protein
MSKNSPDVIVDFTFEQGLLHIAVVNIGEAPAYSISVTFDREIKGVGGRKRVSAMPLFRRIEFMPPGKNITTFLDTSASYFAGSQPLQIKTTINFSDREDKKYSNVIKHNLDIYRDIGYIGVVDRKPTFETD